MGDDHIEHKMLSRGIEMLKKELKVEILMQEKIFLNTMMYQMIKDKLSTLLEINY